jgi:hypothetical protein
LCVYFEYHVVCRLQQKRETATEGRMFEGVAKAIIDPGCAEEIITDQPVKVGETGIAARCDCGGMAACKLKTISIPLVPRIYFCDGSCNGCELTVC